ncbi:unnamed protein product [Cylicocyclus nassatus]|uniref:7TM GPCR serpentine receptor class x (Srx) domain-containing protein n=1 Tax=Cylicocyclus nassatus TaxID=53992 RepID=A0AA36M9V3_CYLNA|nr:unnamed protein product [Cylicocyclus nassatus]
MLVVCLSPFFFMGLFEECAFYFVLETLQFTFGMTQCGTLFVTHFDFYFTAAIFAASSSLDLLTALGIYRYSQDNVLSARQFSNSDVIFFLQCCASNATLIVGFLLIYYLHAICHDRLGAFLTTTFIMQVTHFLDGMAVVLLNRNIRANIFTPHKLLQSQNTSVHRWST